MKNNALWIVLGGIALVVLLTVGWFVSTSNQIVTLDESVSSAQSQVQNAYQRRFDLIPNLVNTVKGYAKHEAEVLETVTQARAQVGQVNLNSAEGVKQFEESNAKMSSALSRLMVVAEKYPDLKANQNFLELQSQLEGTENRISVERRNFNEAAQRYNTFIRKMPQSIIAGMRGATPKPYFQADQGAQSAPKVEF